jgi:pimeloyl-ACP methyl ester carboxylesterase
MATIVLVSGAWLGGWAWQNVARELRQRAHKVYPATLTGLGERVHLARPDVDLETHIADVVNLIAYEDLQDVILVGHSYAGIVVTGVADRVAERLAQVVFVESAPFADGMAYLDIPGPEAADAMRRQVAEEGEGWRLPFPGWEKLGAESSLDGLGDAERARMQSRATAQPFRTYEQRLTLANEFGQGYRLAAIACNDMRRLVAAGIPPIVAMTQPPWRWEELETGHWPMLSTPAELVDKLDSLATTTYGARDSVLASDRTTMSKTPAPATRRRRPEGSALMVANGRCSADYRSQSQR